MSALAPCPPGVDEDAWAGLCARVRADAGWHIAPSVTETIRVAARGQDRIVLPTLHLTAVASATTVATGDLVATSLPIARFTPWGTVYVDASSTYWQRSDNLWADIDVVVTHGHPSCPEDLLDAMYRAARAAAPLGVPAGRVQAGPFSAEYADDLPTPLARAIERYTIADPA